MARVFFLLFGLICSLALAGQTATSKDEVKKVFVGSFGSGAEAEQIRRSLIQKLSRERKLKVVPTPAAADATLTGSGEVWVKGYYSLNPRDREIGEDAHRIYGGYISVELKGLKNEVLWSYLATPQRFGSGPIQANLAGQIAKKLTEAVTH